MNQAKVYANPDALAAIVLAVDGLHTNVRYCKRHALTECDCGSGWTYFCATCAQRDRGKPCKTWQATHPMEVWP